MYLVTGGYTGFSSLSSTEVLLQGAAQWMEVGSLPVATQGLRAVSFNNKILVAGEIMLQYQGIYTTLLQEAGLTTPKTPSCSLTISSWNGSRWGSYKRPDLTMDLVWSMWKTFRIIASK